MMHIAILEGTGVAMEVEDLDLSKIEEAIDYQD